MRSSGCTSTMSWAAPSERDRNRSGDDSEASASRYEALKQGETKYVDSARLSSGRPKQRDHPLVRSKGNAFCSLASSSATVVLPDPGRPQQDHRRHILGLGPQGDRVEIVQPGAHRKSDIFPKERFC